ncbi:tetratricopeptide repeat protein [Devosia sp. 2618]|uniref:tetratricopeptide repeat protein n=1 Tax=Devosia sp. 2618 TaxID=3156454 RepID=UPI003396FE3B
MSQDNIFREVDEELRSDRMRAFWRRFAPYVIGAAVAVVALVAVNEGWTWYHSNNAASSSDELYAAFDLIEGGDLAAAQTQLDKVIADGSGSYPVLAEFRKAGVLAKEGQTTEAVAAYDALANNQSNAHLRELALVLAGNLLIDNGTLSDVESRVGSIAAEGSPMRNAAREALGLAQYKAGNFDAAQASFEAVLNDGMSQSTVRNRMGYYLAQLLSQGAIAENTTDAEAAATAIDAIVNDNIPALDDVVAPVINAPAVEAPAPQAPATETPAAATPAEVVPEAAAPAPATDAPAAPTEAEPAAQ